MWRDKAEFAFAAAVPPVVYQVASGIVCLYLGRDVTPPSPVADLPGNWVDMDWEWGVCSYVIYDGGEALVLDTGVYPSQGEWIRSYVERELGVRRITVVNTHWHLDHTAGNAYFADCPIIASEACRAELVRLADQIEHADLWGEPAVPVVLPNVVFADEARIHVGSKAVQLRRFDLHTPDSVLAQIEGEGVCLVGDMLEDTVPFLTDPAKVPVYLSELGRLRALGKMRLYPCHGNPHVISHGGYGMGFIDAVEEYFSNLMCVPEMLSDGVNRDEIDSLDRFIPQSLQRGDVSVWEPYRKVHRMNIEGILAS